MLVLHPLHHFVDPRKDEIPGYQSLFSKTGFRLLNVNKQKKYKKNLQGNRNLGNSEVYPR